MSRDLIHCNFVKTLTNLTELGPEDGGTVVIAGSHRMPLPPADLIALAEADPSLVHQIVAPAGSTLLFGNISRRRNASFGAIHVVVRNRSIYQDRLGTNTTGTTVKEGGGFGRGDADARHWADSLRA